MAVLIECMNVVVKCEPVARLYPGGVDGLERDCPNKTFCSDGLVARIGFMSVVDARPALNNTTHVCRRGIERVEKTIYAKYLKKGRENGSNYQRKT